MLLDDGMHSEIVNFLFLPGNPYANASNLEVVGLMKYLKAIKLYDKRKT